MSRGKTSMTSFLDLTLIMVGAIAMLAQLNISNIKTAASADIGQHETAQHFAYAPRTLFADNEARLSDKGQAMIAKLAPKIHDGRVRVIVPIDQQAGNSRLNNWELASARTAAIFHALNSHGISETKLESGQMRVEDETPEAGREASKIQIIRITPKT